MTERMDEVISPGRVAVITGAAKGIGAAVASALSRKGMRLGVLDTDGKALEQFAASLETDTVSVVGDVSETSSLIELRDTALSAFGDIALVINNAAVADRAGPWDSPEAWRKLLDVNLFGVVASHNVFLPWLIDTHQPSAIVNLGSKEGITTPPGNAAYSVAKAGVKVLTEQLAHELLVKTGGRVSAHLLVPGYTWTPMNMASKPDGHRKPEDAWTAEDLAEYFVPRLQSEDFYIICPDGAVTPEIDGKRILWSAGDMIENRPALSRWHPAWKDAFAKTLTDGKEA